jgi:glycyl-tRNA synthetase alpha subunit
MFWDMLGNEISATFEIRPLQVLLGKYHQKIAVPWIEPSLRPSCGRESKHSTRRQFYYVYLACVNGAWEKEVMKKDQK